MLNPTKFARLTGRRSPGSDTPQVPEEQLVLGAEARMMPPYVAGASSGKLNGNDPADGGSTAFSGSWIIDPPAGGFNGGDILAQLPRDLVSNTIGAVTVVDQKYFFLPGLYRYHFCMEVSGGVTNFAMAFHFQKAGAGIFPWGSAAYVVMLRKPASVAYRSEVWGRIFLPTAFFVVMDPLQAMLDGDVVMVDATIEHDMLLDEVGSGGGGW